MDSLAVVVGAGRPLGAEVTRRLAARGDQVRAVVLDEARHRELLPREVEVVGVTLDSDSVQQACEGASIIYNCIEPHDARSAAATSQTNSKMLLAAIRHSSRFVLVSHLFTSVRDNQDSERDCMESHRSGLASCAVARFPQIYGPTIENALLDQVFEMVEVGRKAHWLGALDTPHSFVSLGDAARALILLGDSDSAYGDIWTVAGPGPLTGRQFIESAFEAANKEKKVGCWGRGLMFTAGVLDTRARALLEMPYNYYVPFVLKGERFLSEFPSFAYNPHTVAIAETLRWREERALAITR